MDLWFYVCSRFCKDKFTVCRVLDAAHDHGKFDISAVNQNNMNGYALAKKYAGIYVANFIQNKTRKLENGQSYYHKSYFKNQNL